VCDSSNEDKVFFTNDKNKARMFPLMYYVALFFENHGVQNLPSDLKAQWALGSVYN
jgi:hypothetical protein